MIYLKFSQVYFPIYNSDCVTIDDYELVVWKACSYSYDKINSDIDNDIKSINEIDGIYRSSNIMAFKSYDQMKASVDITHMFWI